MIAAKDPAASAPRPARARADVRRRFGRRVALLAAAALLAVSSRPLRAGDGGPPSIAGLAWLAGSWELKNGETMIEEHWTAPSANAMIGMGRTLRGGRTIFFEYLRIEAREDGVYYVAHPKAKPGTDFKLTSMEATQVTFENPKHDFPKRIQYRREPDGSVTALTDAGGAPSSEAPQEFNYRRMPAGRTDPS